MAPVEVMEAPIGRLKAPVLTELAPDPEMEPEMVVDPDPAEVMVTEVPPEMADETVTAALAPGALMVNAPLRVAGPETETTALAAFAVIPRLAAVVVAESVMPVAVASETVTAPPAVTVPPTVMACAPVGLTVTVPVPVVDRVPEIVRAEVRAPLTVTVPAPPVVAVPANVPPTVVMATLPLVDDTELPAATFAVVSAFGKVRAMLPVVVEMTAVVAMVGVWMLLRVRPALAVNVPAMLTDWTALLTAPVTVSVAVAGMVSALPPPPFSVRALKVTDDGATTLRVEPPPVMERPPFDVPPLVIVTATLAALTVMVAPPVYGSPANWIANGPALEYVLPTKVPVPVKVKAPAPAGIVMVSCAIAVATSAHTTSATANNERAIKSQHRDRTARTREGEGEEQETRGRRERVLYLPACSLLIGQELRGTAGP